MEDLPAFSVERLQWEDEALGSIPLPKADLRLTRSFGSGLSRRVSDPPGEVWAVGDRGPNLKIAALLSHYGAEHFARYRELKGAKVMPRLDIGPSLARLRVEGGAVHFVEAFPISDPEGQAVSGLPMPGTEHAVSEPALTLEGAAIPPDPSGLDTEGVVALEDEGFIVSEEFGPSLVRLDALGRVVGRYLPKGINLVGARYPIHETLPPIAAKRQLNRGFEAIAVSPDQCWLWVAFQSPLAHPDEAAHARARHVRLWRLEVGSMTVAAQYLYALDPPDTFARDCAKGRVGWDDLKISELVCLPDGSLLVLERASETTKIYRAHPDDAHALEPTHLDIATRPTVEELSGVGENLPALAKHLLFTTDAAPEVSADLEGMAVLSPTELLLVNDSDFGTEGAATSFWKVTFREPLLG